MSLAMSREEREAFLADLHVGVLSLAEDGRGPLTCPVWYAYEPGGEIVFVTGSGSRKGRLLREGGRASFLVQTEQAPYKYVSVEGAVVETRPADAEADVKPIARRYLGAEIGDRYVESTRAAGQTDDMLVRLRPERWLTVDYTKRFAQGA